MIMKANCVLALVLVLTACSSWAGERTTTVMAPAQEQIVAPQSLLTTSDQEPPLVFFTSEPGKFQVWLPASGSVQDYTERKTLFNETIECPNLFFRLNGAYAAVQYCDLIPQSVASLSDEEILDQAQSEVIGDIHVKIETQQRVAVQDTYPALELFGQVDMRGMGYDGTFKARMILVDERLYLIVMSVYHEDWCNCLHQMDQVVDSLYIEPSLSIPFEPTP
jgi:hypothetical protein